jgi:hypothetical protein
MVQTKLRDANLTLPFSYKAMLHTNTMVDKTTALVRILVRPGCWRGVWALPPVRAEFTLQAVRREPFGLRSGLPLLLLQRGIILPLA